MPAGYDIALLSTLGILAAADLPLPVELTALAMVGLVIRWSLGRMTRDQDEHEKRMTALEAEMAEVREEASQQRHLKHNLDNRITAMGSAIFMMLPQAQACECGSMSRLVPILEHLAINPITLETQQ